MLDRKFRVPRAADAKQWEKVRRLIQAGFRFHSVWEHLFGGCYRTAKYPEGLGDVAPFIAAYVPRAGRPGKCHVGRNGIRGFET
jgi:hypothetical protein